MLHLIDGRQSCEHSLDWLANANLDTAHLDIYAGATMLIGLGIAMAIMAYVLAVGTRGE